MVTTALSGDHKPKDEREIASQSVTGNHLKDHSFPSLRVTTSQPKISDYLLLAGRARQRSTFFSCSLRLFRARSQVL